VRAYGRADNQAFTASANKWTRSEIAHTLGMDKTNFDMWVLPVNRSNIYYEVSLETPLPFQWMARATRRLT
jgi:superfamily II DNA helicase RecQ